MSHRAEKPKLRRTPHEEVGPMYPVQKPVDRGYDLTVNPANGKPRFFHSSMNALAMAGSAETSGFHGVKKVMWVVSFAAAPACSIS